MKTSVNAVSIKCKYQQFPWKLHEMLDLADEEGFAHIVSWSPDGRSFRVHDKDGFAETLMSDYFKSDRYKTFQRNLNLWGFRTYMRGPEKGAIYHEHFVRGQRDLCDQMVRVRVKQKNARKIARQRAQAMAEAASSRSGEGSVAAAAAAAAASGTLPALNIQAPPEYMRQLQQQHFLHQQLRYYQHQQLRYYQHQQSEQQQQQQQQPVETGPQHEQARDHAGSHGQSYQHCISPARTENQQKGSPSTAKAAVDAAMRTTGNDKTQKSNSRDDSVVARAASALTAAAVAAASSSSFFPPDDSTDSQYANMKLPASFFGAQQPSDEQVGPSRKNGSSNSAPSEASTTPSASSLPTVSDAPTYPGNFVSQTTATTATDATLSSTLAVDPLDFLSHLNLLLLLSSIHAISSKLKERQQQQQQHQQELMQYIVSTLSLATASELGTEASTESDALRQSQNDATVQGANKSSGDAFGTPSGAHRRTNGAFAGPHGQLGQQAYSSGASQRSLKPDNGPNNASRLFAAEQMARTQPNSSSVSASSFANSSALSLDGSNPYSDVMYQLLSTLQQLTQSQQARSQGQNRRKREREGEGEAQDSKPPPAARTSDDRQSASPTAPKTLLAPKPVGANFTGPNLSPGTVDFGNIAGTVSSSANDGTTDSSDSDRGGETITDSVLTTSSSTGSSPTSTPPLRGGSLSTEQAPLIVAAATCLQAILSNIQKNASSSSSSSS